MSLACHSNNNDNGNGGSVCTVRTVLYKAVLIVFKVAISKILAFFTGGGTGGLEYIIIFLLSLPNKKSSPEYKTMLNAMEINTMKALCSGCEWNVDAHSFVR